jgi:hypothetical protein
MSGSPPRSIGRPKSSNNLHNRTILDIRAIQPPLQSNVIVILYF